jgi:hypothetical protein
MILFIPKVISITQLDELLMGKEFTFASLFLWREKGVSPELELSILEWNQSIILPQSMRRFLRIITH